ncbi:CMRF35-like molecule 9 [Suncus etruscus]|uniref:CMRF35-like molecule 9 n=1 Tax=Suncus etruscus TaxID=109475 RepID=UPI00210F5228|nr:CMRF35-like molecule 9 [Suncus etruscus]
MRPLFLLWGCLVLPGYGDTIVGPKEVSGFEGDTMSLQCTYGDELKKFQKYWCKESGLFVSRCTNTIYANTDGQEMTKGRVSIQDSRPERALKVTLQKLSLEDAGTYWCGVSRLGIDIAFSISLLVFPGPCCPPSPAPFFRPLTTTSRRLGPMAHMWHTQAPGLNLWGAAEPGYLGSGGCIQANSLSRTRCYPPLPSTYTPVTVEVGGAPRGHEGTFLSPGTSPSVGTSPYTHAHAATSPPAGTSRPTARLDPSSAKDPSLVARSSSSSKPRTLVSTARFLAPVWVLVSLLLVTALAALGRCMFCWREEDEQEDLSKDKNENVHLTHMGNYGPQYTLRNLALLTEPDSSPLPLSTETGCLNQTSEENQASPLDLKGDLVPQYPLQLPGQESGFLPV